MAEPVIIDAVRTPIGRYKGAYRETRPDQLLAHALQNVIKKTGVDVVRIGDSITGCVSQIGEQGVCIARRTALLAGLPITVPGVALNRFCSSGQQAVHFAAQAIAAGDHDYVLASGVESMTRVQMGSDGGEAWKAVYLAMREHYDLIHQGESAERLAEKWNITRRDVDEFAAESHRRAAEAANAGRHTEIIPTPGLDAEGRHISLTRDEGIREVVNMEKMAALPTVFRPDGNGVVTAANSSQISDGAGAVLVAGRDVAMADGLKPRAAFRARVVVGSDPTIQLDGVIPATRLALEKAGLSIGDLDWIEINEAFATVVISWAREFKPDLSKVNPWGGAIAHGHPIGGTGSILMAKLLAGLDSVDGQFGLQVMCAGHGMATATIIERLR
ncbi:MAG: thiolase family protein [Acidobacteriota bacterium]|nr:MAG: thiolase family protein [Acidobacteriota bacterium]